MSTSDLEDLLQSNLLNKGGVHRVDAIIDALSRLSSLGVDYALVGTIALGIHARPRFTDTIQIIVSEAPSIYWRKALQLAGYIKLFDSQEYQYCLWRLQDVKLSISISSSTASLSAIHHACFHNVFGKNVRVAQPKDLLWLYLEAEDQLGAISEAIELITNCHQIASQLRAQLNANQLHLISTLDLWTEKSHLAKTSNYSDSVVARLSLKASQTSK